MYIYQQLNLQNNINKQNRNRITVTVDSCQMGEFQGEWAEKVNELRSTYWYLQNSHGDVEYSIGNMVAKEHICITHGHKQLCGDCLREWGKGWQRLGQL